MVAWYFLALAVYFNHYGDDPFFHVGAAMWVVMLIEALLRNVRGSHLERQLVEATERPRNRRPPV